MEITLLSEKADAVRVAVSGKMTQNYTLSVGDPLEKACGEDVYQRRVLMDMHGVEAADSSGINWLLQRRAKFREEGGRMVLHSMPLLVANTLKMLRMHLVLELADDEESALARLEQEEPK